MDEYLENINEYKRIGALGAKICDHLLDKLKTTKPNTESTVTLFSGFDDITLLYLNLLQLIISDKKRVFCKTSLFALSRSMIELTNTIHFFFLDKVDEIEADFRLNPTCKFTFVTISISVKNDFHFYNWGTTFIFLVKGRCLNPSAS